MHFPELFRVDSIQEDLEFYLGSNWAQQVKRSPATADYVSRIRMLSRDNPVLLLAHAYTRYLGDLSGGQILARVVSKLLAWAT